MISVIIPVYNEAESIAHDIDSVHKAFEGTGLVYELLVIDDASTDGSGDAARAKGVRVITHKRNKGVGGARKTGIMEAKYDIVATTDGDGTYPNHEMPGLARLVGEYDMVVGARTGSKVYTSWIRWLPKYLIRQLAAYLTRHEIPDLNSGLRVFKKDVALKYFYLLPDSHSWESTITLSFLFNNHPVKFVPVDYYKRLGGKSSFTPFRDTYNYISLVIRTVMYFNPLRIFIPLTIVSAALSAAKCAFDICAYSHLSQTGMMMLIFTFNVVMIGLLADLVVVSTRKRA
ncbi:MAG: glycosyltransferase family 2 protein [Elusimicrobiales bacterium]|nr:glycosyltransferase family 2 protein [Elusimicrobiales bacterium]